MKTKKILAVSMIAAIMFSGCATMNNKTKGGLIGGGAGAAVGAGIGALIGNGKGAAIGGVVGGGAGILIGNKMDKQKAELERIEGAKVELITDANNLKAIKVTFDNGILFATGRSELNATSKHALLKFAESLKNTTETDITIYGHTDNTGSRDFNVKLSLQRAVAVAGFLNSNGVEMKRLDTEGKAWDFPVGDNTTVSGRAMNRRVEVYITANETMIKEAEQGKPI